MSIYPIYNRNGINISTNYKYNKTGIKRDILTIKKIHREVGRAKDLSVPRYLATPASNFGAFTMLLLITGMFSSGVYHKMTAIILVCVKIGEPSQKFIWTHARTQTHTQDSDRTKLPLACKLSTAVQPRESNMSRTRTTALRLRTEKYRQHNNNYTKRTFLTCSFLGREWAN